MPVLPHTTHSSRPIAPRPPSKERLTAAQAQSHEFFKGLDEVAPLSPDVIDSLKRSTSHSRLQNTFFQVFAAMLRPEQEKSMRAQFANLDEYHNGEISFEEFKHALERSGVEMDEASVTELFQCIDFDRQGVIHWNEFLAATLDVTEIEDQEMRTVFGRLDTDGSGYISFDNLKSLIGDDCSDEELHNMLNSVEPELELKHSEQIQFDEFVSIVNSVHAAAVRKLTADNADPAALATEDVPLMVDGEAGFETPSRGKQPVKIDFKT